MKRLPSIVRYYGGKWRMAPRILEFFPRNYRELQYYEPCAGSAAMLFYKQRSIAEHISDVDSLLINMYRQIRDNPLSVRHYASQWAGPGKYDCVLGISDTDTDVIKAAKYFANMNHAFSGLSETGISTDWKGTAKPYQNKCNLLPAYSKRLQGVSIHETDFIQVLKTKLVSNCFAYLDPPYVLSSRNSEGYAHEMLDEQHELMLQIATGSYAKILISGYGSALYAKYLKGWNKYRFVVSQSCYQLRDTRTEILWSNYTP